MIMSEYQKIADKINNTEDYANCLDDMRALCHAAGIDEELAKRPDDADWVWEVAWQAAQKLDVHIDTPYFHFYEDFRIEVKSSETEDVHGVKRHYSCPVFWADDYFAAKDKLKQLSVVFDEGMRIVGVEKEPNYLIKTHAEGDLVYDETGCSDAPQELDLVDEYQLPDSISWEEEVVAKFKTYREAYDARDTAQAHADYEYRYGESETLHDFHVR